MRAEAASGPGPSRPVALVSGGGRGLGAARVSGFLGRGCAVAAFSRSRSSFIQQVLTEREGQGDFRWDEVDALDADALRSFVSATVERFGRLDVLVNNAAIAPEGVLPTMRHAEIEATIGL